MDAKQWTYEMSDYGVKTANSNSQTAIEKWDAMEIEMQEPTFIWETILMYGSLFIMVMGIVIGMMEGWS